MSLERKLRFGIPKGSLNDPKRDGFTSGLLKAAGYDIEGYEPGEEQLFPVCKNDPEIEFKLIRPQDAYTHFINNDVDIAIAGRDWIIESYLRNVKVKEEDVRKEELKKCIIKLVSNLRNLDDKEKKMLSPIVSEIDVLISEQSGRRDIKWAFESAKVSFQRAILQPEYDELVRFVKEKKLPFKILSLNYGRVKLVFATKEILDKQKDINHNKLHNYIDRIFKDGNNLECYTEYTSIAHVSLVSFLLKYKPELIEKISIKEIHGNEEAHLDKLVLCTMQKGESLRKAGGMVIEEVLDSSATFYATSSLKFMSPEYMKIKEISENLYDGMGRLGLIENYLPPKERKRRLKEFIEKIVKKLKKND